MSRSDRQIDDMVAALVELARKVGEGKEQTCCGKCGAATRCIKAKCGGDPKIDDRLYVVEELAQKFRRAVVRDRSGNAFPDGFPPGSGSDGGSGHGLRMTIDDEHGEPDSIDVTGVEYAMFLRDAERARLAEGKTPKDYHHVLTLRLISALDVTLSSLNEMNAILARIDNLVDTNPDAASATKGCRSHERVRDALGRPYFEPVAREDGGRDGLCRWCWGFLKDHEELPSVALLERKIRKGVVTNRDIEETRKRAS